MNAALAACALFAACLWAAWIWATVDRLRRRHADRCQACGQRAGVDWRANPTACCPTHMLRRQKVLEAAIFGRPTIRMTPLSTHHQRPGTWPACRYCGHYLERLEPWALDRKATAAT